MIYRPGQPAPESGVYEIVDEKERPTGAERAVALDQVWGTEGLTLYQRPTNYVDASVSYDVTPDFTVYLQGSNLTNEYEDYYLQFPNQYGYQNIYERRLLLGVRARFGAAKR